MLQDVSHLHPLSTNSRIKKKERDKKQEEYSRELHTIEKQGNKINWINNRNKQKIKEKSSKASLPLTFPNPPLIAFTKYLLGKVVDVFVLFQNN